MTTSNSGGEARSDALESESVAILADDLTGALDAGAKFATPNAPLTVRWSSSSDIVKRRIAFDTESRDVAAIRASRAVRRLLPKLASSGAAFKKIDSLLRGNTFVEIEACRSSGVFKTIVIAPAFPEQGRVTRLGRQFVRSADGAWRIAAGDLGKLARNDRRRVRLIPAGECPAGDGVILCDAETPEDLRRVAAAGRNFEPPILWCGSAGLAGALAGSCAPYIRPAGQRTLAIVGSTHQTTLRQLQTLDARRAGQLMSVRSRDEVDAAVALALRRLTEPSAVTLALAPVATNADEAADLHKRAFARLAETPSPDIVVLVGGDTLFRVCRALSATQLEAIGEWAPGVAVSRFADGAWTGATIISKSGAFGGDMCLVDILDATRAQEAA